MGISNVLSSLGLISTPNRGFPTTTVPSPVVPTPAQVRRETVPFHKLAAMSGLGEQINLSQTADIANINAALRQSERGNPWILYTFYRDFVLGSAHIQSVWGTRKQAVVGEPHTIIPASKSLEDKKAADAIKELIDNCENWHDGLLALLDATLYPNSIVEKIFGQPTGNEVTKLTYSFRRFEPVNPLLHWYGLPFMGSGQFVLSGGAPMASQVSPVMLPNINPFGTNDSLVYNPNEWEPEIRLYNVLDNGFVDKSPGNSYKLEKIRHIVHRGGTLGTTVRDCYGGHMRSVLIWTFFSVLGRDNFMKLMDNYGQPLPVVRGDLQLKDTVDFLTQAFQDCWKRHALILDKITEADLRFEAVDMQGFADAQELWLNMCKSEITHLIIGQELSHTAKATGLGSGVAKLQGEVREDIRRWDIVKLGTTLKQQLFAPYLALNGIPGKAPSISWGGVVPEDAKTISEQLANLANAGLEPDDESLEALSEKFGYTLQRRGVSMPIPTAKDNEAAQKTFNAEFIGTPSTFCSLCDCEDCDTPDPGCDHWCHGNVYAVSNAQARTGLKDSVRERAINTAKLGGADDVAAKVAGRKAVHAVVHEMRTAEAEAEEAAKEARRQARKSRKPVKDQEEAAQNAANTVMAANAAARQARAKAKAEGKSVEEQQAAAQSAAKAVEAAAAAALLVSIRHQDKADKGPEKPKEQEEEDDEPENTE